MPDCGGPQAGSPIRPAHQGHCGLGSGQVLELRRRSDRASRVLDGVEKDIVARHARRRFPELVPAGSAGFDDLPFLDRQRARRWYGRPVDGAREFSSTGTSGQPKPVPWTSEEDGWYVAEKQDLLGPWLRGCSRVRS